MDRGKVGHSSEGLIDSHLGVIEDSTDSGVDLRPLSCLPRHHTDRMEWRIARSEEAQESQDKLVTTIGIFSKP